MLFCSSNIFDWINCCSRTSKLRSEWSLEQFRLITAHIHPRMTNAEELGYAGKKYMMAYNAIVYVYSNSFSTILSLRGVIENIWLRSKYKTLFFLRRLYNNNINEDFVCQTILILNLLSEWVVHCEIISRRFPKHCHWFHTDSHYENTKMRKIIKQNQFCFMFIFDFNTIAVVSIKKNLKWVFLSLSYYEFSVKTAKLLM
jgi:hypothetical protein